MKIDGPSSHLTECGIPGIGPVPYGIHLCHFYSQRQDLVEILVPYFRAGLRKNERCLWITEAPLPAAEARAELLKQVPEMGQMIGSGQLRIIDALDWYGTVKAHVAADHARLWVEAEESALAAGYSGLRVSGNMSCLQKSDWDAFMACEGAITPALDGRRIVALCSYHLEQCRPTDFLDVVRAHHFTFDRVDTSSWQVRQRTDELPLFGMAPQDSPGPAEGLPGQSASLRPEI